MTLSPEMVAEYDAVVLLTDHSDVDYDMLRSHARLLVDTRGRYRGHNGDNLVRA